MSLLVQSSLFLFLLVTELIVTESRNVPMDNGSSQDFQDQINELLQQQLRFARERRAIYRFPEYADYGRTREKKPHPGKIGYSHPSYGVLTYALG